MDKDAKEVTKDDRNDGEVEEALVSVLPEFARPRPPLFRAEDEEGNVFSLLSLRMEVSGVVTLDALVVWLDEGCNSLPVEKEGRIRCAT